MRNYKLKSSCPQKHLRSSEMRLFGVHQTLFASEIMHMEQYALGRAVSISVYCIKDLRSYPSKFRQVYANLQGKNSTE